MHDYALNALAGAMFVTTVALVAVGVLAVLAWWSKRRG